LSCVFRFGKPRLELGRQLAKVCALDLFVIAQSRRRAVETRRGRDASRSPSRRLSSAREAFCSTITIV
jgi:hypothetical protein